MELAPYSELKEDFLFKDYEATFSSAFLFSESPRTGLSPPDGIGESKHAEKFSLSKSCQIQQKPNASQGQTSRFFFDSIDQNSVEIPSPPSSPKARTVDLESFSDEVYDNVILSHNLENALEAPSEQQVSKNHHKKNSSCLDKFKRLKSCLYQFTFFVGPGWLVSMAYLDPGNLEGDLTVGNIRTVPGSGYQLLWLLLLAHIMGWSLQVLAIRLGNATGMDLASLCRSEYSRTVAYSLWFFVEVAIIGADLQAVIGTAIALNLLLGIPLVIGIVITLVDTFVFLVIQVFGVRKLEFFFAILVGIMAACFWINLVISKPNIFHILEGSFIPRIPKGEQLAALGLVGSVIMPHNLFLHSSLVQSRNIKRTDAKRVKQANAFFGIETAIALAISFCINLAVVGSFANPKVVLPPGSKGLSLGNADKALKNAFGNFSVFIWALGLLAAGQNATMAGTFAGQFLMQGIFRLKVNPVVRIIITRLITIVPLLLITLLTSSSIDVISRWVNVLQSVLLPIALLPLLKFNFSINAMGKVVVSKFLKVCYILIAFAVIGGNLVLVSFTIISEAHSIVFWYIAAAAFAAYLAVLFFFSIKSINGNYCRHAYQAIPEGSSDL